MNLNTFYTETNEEILALLKTKLPRREITNYLLTIEKMLCCCFYHGNRRTMVNDMDIELTPGEAGLVWQSKDREEDEWCLAILNLQKKTLNKHDVFSTAVLALASYFEQDYVDIKNRISLPAVGDIFHGYGDDDCQYVIRHYDTYTECFKVSKEYAKGHVRIEVKTDDIVRADEWTKYYFYHDFSRVNGAVPNNKQQEAVS